VLRSLRVDSLEWLIALIAALIAAMTLAATGPAHAGFLDFLFGPRQSGPPADASSYAEPSAANPSKPLASESVRSSGSTGHAVAFCVRLCDGMHFPLEHLPYATPVETCRAMCPASRTKVFFGSEIDHAAAADSSHYTDLGTAFVYRQHLVPNCTCNGKDAFGLAPFDLSNDPTLRPGDIVATQNGYKVYAGKRGQTDAFTPIDAATVEAQLNPAPQAARTARRRNTQPAVADEEPRIIVPKDDDVQAAR
jgi:hypothetical protein